MLVWKLSLSSIDHLRDRIKAHTPDIPGFWPRITRDYLATVDLLDELWRQSGLSCATSLIFVVDLLFIACGVGIAEADRGLFLKEGSVIIVSLACPLCIGLYQWAKLHDACASEA